MSKVCYDVDGTFLKRSTAVYDDTQTNRRSQQMSIVTTFDFIIDDIMLMPCQLLLAHLDITFGTPIKHFPLNNVTTFAALGHFPHLQGLQTL